jgi:ABC-type Zn uptake system ZnuABC Zn-binding protein ZnuA
MLRMSLICVAAALPLLGCRSADEGGDAEVVATTTQVADIAQNVAGDEEDVHGILSPNADPHDYEPRPSDATAIAAAKVVITSGGEADEWVEELIESSGTDAQVIELLDLMPIVRTEAGDVDPHWWQDPRNAIAAAEVIRDELSDAEPGHTTVYERNAANYISAIHRADRAVAGCMNSMPGSARKLVTSHDSLGYLADRYDIEIVGAAVPALSTQAQPSSGETAKLVDLIEAENVQAVFPEAGLSGELEHAIAEEANVEVGGDLYADALGEEGSAGDTYLGALDANASALVRGLSDGSHRCDPLGVP